MTTIAGASRFLSAATLANTQGVAAQAPTLLGESDTASLLDAGRGVSAGNNGIGLSSSARAVNNSFLNRTADINALLSLAVGADATIEGMQQQILALRSTLPSSAVHSSVFFDADEVDADDGSVSPSEIGTEVDEEA